MLQRRVQILMDERRYARLEEAAAERGISVAAVVRSLVDTMLPASERRRVEAAEWLLDAAEHDPIPVPDDPAELRRELAAAREERLGDLAG